MAQWVDDRCITGQSARGYRELVSRLYADFQAWCVEEGIGDPLSATAFGRRLTRLGITLAGKDGAGLKMRGPVRLALHTGGASKVSSLQARDRPRSHMQVSANFGKLFSEGHRRPTVVQVLGPNPHAADAAANALRRGHPVRVVDRALTVLLPRTQARRILAAAKADVARDHHPANSGV